MIEVYSQKCLFHRVLKNNKYLHVIHEDAFKIAFGPTVL